MRSNRSGQAKPRLPSSRAPAGTRRRVLAILDAVGLLAAGTGVAPHIRHLPGHTNLAFDVRIGIERFAVRLPTGDRTPHADEALATATAWRLGIGAEPVWIAPAGGAAITRWIARSRPLTPAGAQARPDIAAAVARSLRLFHDSGANLSARHDPAAVIQSSLAAMGTFSDRTMQHLPDRRHLTKALQRLATAAAECVPSHGDPSCSNILLTPAGIRLIDWEYAAMAPRTWDLGYFAAEAGLDPAIAPETLATAYRHPAVTADLILDAMLAAAVMNLLWAEREAASGRAQGSALVLQARHALLATIVETVALPTE